MMNRITVARLLAHVPADQKLTVFRAFRPQNGSLDRAYRGEGNRALRRQGIAITRSCGCSVCVVYGGDCARVMWQEGHDEWHRAKRGVKTRRAGTA